MVVLGVIRSITRAALVTTIVSGASSSLAAQIGAGARIRVSLKPPMRRTLVGTLDTLRNDSLQIQAESGIVNVPLADIETLEVSTGRHSLSRTGVRIGTIAGMAAGLAVGTAHLDDCGSTAFSDICGTSNASLLIVSSVAGGLAGAGLGWLVGSRFHAEGWKVVPTGPHRVAITFSLSLDALLTASP